MDEPEKPRSTDVREWLDWMFERNRRQVYLFGLVGIAAYFLVLFTIRQRGTYGVLNMMTIAPLLIGMGVFITADSLRERVDDLDYGLWGVSATGYFLSGFLLIITGVTAWFVSGVTGVPTYPDVAVMLMLVVPTFAFVFATYGLGLAIASLAED